MAIKKGLTLKKFRDLMQKTPLIERIFIYTFMGFGGGAVILILITLYAWLIMPTP